MDLTPLLIALMSGNNDIRSQAEKSLNDEWIAKASDSLLIQLARQTRVASDETLRSFAAVLLRKIGFKTTNKEDDTKTIWEGSAEPTREQVKAVLLEGYENETVVAVRNQLCDTIADVARDAEENSKPWNELLNALFQSTKSPEPAHRESAFRVFAALPSIVDRSHVDLLKGVFLEGLQDPAPQVRLSALKAVCGYFVVSEQSLRSKMSPLLDPLLNVLPPLLAEKQSDPLREALLELIEVATEHPTMFRGCFSHLMQFAVSVIKEKDLDDDTRQAALELLVTFAEGAPNMCRKDPNYTMATVEQILGFMCDHDPEPEALEEWRNTDDLDFDESDANWVVGEQAIDRLARKLGAKTIIPPAFTYLPRLISSSDWRERHASLMAISSIAEGCEKYMKAELSRVLDMILPCLNDPHPRVRWAACNAVGQLSTDLAPTIQQNAHERIMHALVPLLDAQEPRVQAHAAAALVNFCEPIAAEDQIIEPYLDGILERLLGLLRSPKRYVQEQAVTTIATVADAAADKFVKYYEHIMPLLINAMSLHGEEKEYRILRAKAIECATLIALAVGKDVFGKDAMRVMQLMARIQQSITEPDDPQASYLITAWGRICRTLGSQFVPFLPEVMPPLLASAQLKPDFAIIDGTVSYCANLTADESEKEQYAAEDGWDFVPVHGQQVGIKTSVLEEKCTAYEMLCCYAQELKGDFFNFVPSVLKELIIPGLKFYFHDGVRSASAKCLPFLVESAKEANPHDPSVAQKIFKSAIEALLDRLADEASPDMCAEFYEAFYETVDIGGNNCLSSPEMNTFIEVTASQLKDYGTRKTQRDEQIASGERDIEEDEDIQEAIDTDEALLSSISKSIHTIFKRHKLGFLPIWAKMTPYIEAGLASTEPSTRSWAICIIDDVIEYCNGDALHFIGNYLPVLASCVTDESSEIRQAAAYGVGVAAHHGGPQYAGFCAMALEPLFQCIARPYAREEEAVYATENACAAIAKIIHFNASNVPNLDQVISSWLDTLPIVNDEEEAPHAYNILMDLAERGNPVVMSQVPKVFNAVAAAIEGGSIEGKTLARVVETTKRLLVALPAGGAQRLFTAMPPERQIAVAEQFK